MLLRAFRAFPKGMYRIQQLDQKCTCQVRSWRRYTHSQPAYTPSSHDYKKLEADIQKLLDTAKHYSLTGPTLVKHIKNGVADLRKDGHALTPAIYDALLHGYIKSGKRNKVMSLIRQMEDDGLAPSFEFIHSGLEFAAWSGDAILQAKLLDRMRIYGMERTTETYQLIMRCISQTNEFERALDTLDEMKAAGITPTVNNYITAIHLAILYDESAVAFDLLAQAESLAVEITDKRIYIKALRSAAITNDYPSVRNNWKRFTEILAPDDGLCKSALLVASNNHDPQLAHDILDTIGKLGYPYCDHHFSCLIESFASTLDYKNTLRVFSVMRKAGLTPTKTTGTPIAYYLGKDLNAVIQARQALIELGATEPDSVDIVAFNLIIHCFAYNSAFDQAMTTFDMAKDLGVTPDHETLDALLDACIHQRSAIRGETLLQQFIDAGIQPTRVTLSKMVALMCTQDNFEDAFMYLEKIKNQGDIPLRGAYYRLVKKLAASDDPRLSLAQEDMRACGYEMSAHMDDYIDQKAVIHEKRQRIRMKWLIADDNLY